MIAYNTNFIFDFFDYKKEKSDTFETLEFYKSSKEIDVFKHKIDFGKVQGRKIILSSNNIFDQNECCSLFTLHIDNVVTFLWENKSKTIMVYLSSNTDEHLFKYYVLHTFSLFYFTIEEKYHFLHAGSVDIENNAILFVADSFGGKSTLTDYFIKRGHILISDDKVVVKEMNGQFYAIPSFPYHRPYRKIEDLGLCVKDFPLEVKHIHAIYELLKSRGDASIEIIELEGIEKFIALRYASELNLSHLKDKRFEYLMKIAEKIPVYRVVIPWNLKRLPEVYDAIVRHSNTLKT